MANYSCKKFSSTT